MQANVEQAAPFSLMDDKAAALHLVGKVGARELLPLHRTCRALRDVVHTWAESEVPEGLKQAFPERDNRPNPLRWSLVAGGWWFCWLSSRLHWASRSGPGGPHCVKSPSFLPLLLAAMSLASKEPGVFVMADTCCCQAATGVISTLTYVDHLIKMGQPRMTPANSKAGPYALILTHTRDRALQIQMEFARLAQLASFRTVCVVGGQSVEAQGRALSAGCEILIATPYRLVDCLEQHYLVLEQCHYIVLDEADRMIDLGFEPQVLGVIDAMPSSNLRPENEAKERKAIYRTAYMFSATMPPAIERLARKLKYLRRPIVVTIGSTGKATESHVTQRVVIVKEHEKAHRLEQELDVVEEKRAIVFVNTKKQCDNVYGKLSESLGYRCAVLHGGRNQEQREDSIKGFRDGTYNILVATDVAGRGIDESDVALVVNYDMPGIIEPYTHRIGRTGRAGKKSIAITFLTMNDTDVFWDLKRVLEESKASVPPELARHD